MTQSHPVDEARMNYLMGILKGVGLVLEASELSSFNILIRHVRQRPKSSAYDQRWTNLIAPIERRIDATPLSAAEKAQWEAAKNLLVASVYLFAKRDAIYLEQLKLIYEATQNRLAFLNFNGYIQREIRRLTLK